MEEFGRAGTTVMFVQGPRSDSPEDALLVQFQGMIAEYKRAEILARTTPSRLSSSAPTSSSRSERC